MIDRLATPHHQFAEFFIGDEIKPLAFAVSKNLSGQSICIDPMEDLEGLLEDWGDLSKTELSILIEHARTPGKYIGTNENEQKPFIFNNGKLYLKRYFNYENSVIDGIKRIKDGGGEQGEKLEYLKSSPYLKVLKALRDNEEVIDRQLIAVITAYLQNFTVITGGPGTGKTTTVAKILALLLEENPELQVRLAAFTGKAAKRMEESLGESAGKIGAGENVQEKLKGISAQTLHRLLKFIPGSHNFRHNKENPITADVIIIDEASMIDTALFAKLLNAIREGSKLILLGDKNQLESVEAGSVFGDICNSVEVNKFSELHIKKINATLSENVLGEESFGGDDSLLSDNIIGLTKSYRVKDNDQIVNLAIAILNHKEEIIEGIYSREMNSEKLLLDQNHKASVFEEFVTGFKAFIIEADKGTEANYISALGLLNNLRILSPVREGKQGIYYLNQMVEEFLKKEGVLHPEEEMYQNRPVMITRNNYELGIFNGDVGIVRFLDDTAHIYFLNNKGELKNHPAAYIPEMETVFACTVHKSQGSEFDEVLVVLPKKFKERVMTRELLYTAVTRAKKKVVLQATEEAVLNTMKNKIRRASGVTTRINLKV